ncbi:hypothetical protein [Motiliproteus sp. MSK22-1]|uniref:hypothetical protein n=1 Tax=Motiliproteus sp. MSK22-1 TaxID=1897630 RepID=UPI00097629BF|nr:hypothetical protein [Motiliproteus sp. MSK22-1]OMH36145.1 hypothetical protein BGP75_10360 [Motiliproteus sp. MSK22-1]
MNNLFTYIEAIKSNNEKLRIIDKVEKDLSYCDQGMTVNSTEVLFYFSNGVTLKYCVEFDETLQLSEVCPECWISYEVMDSSTVKITPIRKSFISQCQEVFWLKTQKCRNSQ